MLRQRVCEPRDAGDGRRGGAQEDERAGDADRDPERVHQDRGQLSVEGCGDADERRLEPLVSERGRPVVDGIRGETDCSDEDGHEHDESDCREERARQRPAGLARLLGEVGGRLQARVGEHRERQGEREIAPVLSARDAEPLSQDVGREEKCGAEQDEHPLDDEVEDRDGERADVEARVPEEPHACDRGRSRDSR